MFYGPDIYRKCLFSVREMSSTDRINSKYVTNVITWHVKRINYDGSRFPMFKSWKSTRKKQIKVTQTNWKYLMDTKKSETGWVDRVNIFFYTCITLRIHTKSNGTIENRTQSVKRQTRRFYWYNWRRHRMDHHQHFCLTLNSFFVVNM